MTGVIGEPVSRVDGPEKVTGGARYAAEFELPGLVHAALVTSPLPRGRIVAVDDAEALAAPGVLAVISHRNAPRLPYRERDQRPPVDPQAGHALRVFQDAEIRFVGQPLAVVVAETEEQARHAARLVRVEAEAADARLTFTRGDGRPPSGPNADNGRPGDARRGDADAALAAASVTIAAHYTHPREHHAAIEPHVTIAAWEADRLTLYDKTQWVGNVRKEIGLIFGLPDKDVRVISPFVGGAFGSALRVWPHVTVAALAARMVRRPVRLELTRRDLFAAVGYRPHTEQQVALGADRDGRLRAIVHEAWGQTSAYEEYAETTLSPTRNLYACGDVRTGYRLVEMDASTPCPMRAPGIVSGLYALEAAMDELAVELAIDPVALRLRNFADRDQGRDLPWSSNGLRECYETASRHFGWKRRDPAPRSMRDGRLALGWGMATAAYHANRAPAAASAALYANGTALVRSAASDMGPGTYTSMSQIAADALGLSIEAVRFDLGDSDYPTAPVHGGSITMASVGNAVAAACAELGRRVIDLARGPDGPFAGEAADALVCRAGQIARRDGSGTRFALADLLTRCGREVVEATARAAPEGEDEHHSSSAFGAVFVEVTVDEALGVIRIPRIVGAYDIGRVLNPKVARSQCIGGMVGGIGMALMEEAEWDERLGRVMNANLAEYLVPVCADVGEMDVHFVAGDDRIFNPLGVKGVAEIAICGIAPAIVNAVYHATGRRLRRLPLTPEALLG